MEGKNLAIEYRFGNFRPELLPQAASDLVRLDVSAIFAATPEAGAAAKNATTSIPIVALDLETDPLAKGYVRVLPDRAAIKGKRLVPMRDRILSALQ